ncbi:MAG: radical SAM protein [Dehalococcoidia bacterium]|nr:radical SAM protein [Dehalococcoidia bacterium]
MVTVTRAKRRSPVLTPSGLACLSVLPTVNLTVGCLHDCVYCYIRGYRNYPGEGRIVLYEDTLERLRHELRPGQPKPRAVYFSPSSDLFQPAPEVLEMSHAVLEFLFSQGIGVAFLTKGEIPDETLELLIDHAELVQAQVGLITLDEEIARAFESHAASPRTRLWQLHSLIAGGVAAAARLDPILPTLTDDAEALDRQFAALAQVGVKRVAAGVLFLRSGISYWLSRRVPPEMLAPLLVAYREEEQAVMRGAEYPIQNLSAERRRGIFARLQKAAEAHGIQPDVCACKNSDIARGSCNIAGTWAARTARAAQPQLLRLV